VVIVNSSLFDEPVARERWQVFDVAATEVAGEELGNPQAVSMVAAGAYVALTGLVELDSAITAMEESLPSYRRQHAEANATALRSWCPAARAAGRASMSVPTSASRSSSTTTQRKSRCRDQAADGGIRGHGRGRHRVRLPLLRRLPHDAVHRAARALRQEAPRR